MGKRMVLSERKVKSYAALKGWSAKQLNNEAGFGTNYIYRLWQRDNVTLATVNDLAAVLDCSAVDLLEEAPASE